RGGKWEVHTNPHDARQVWIRLPDGHLTEIPWIHRDHIHQPFNSATWQHIKTITVRHGDRDTHEAHLADALDQLMRRAHTGTAAPGEQRLITRTAPLKTPPPPDGTRPPRTPDPQADDWDEDSLDDLDGLPDDAEQADCEDEPGDDNADTPVPYTGLGLYNPAQEALNW
ncbi:transposase, partial [Streptomyces sp. NPDC056159]